VGSVEALGWLFFHLSESLIIMPITLLPSGQMSLESAFPWRGLQTGHGISRVFQSFDEMSSGGKTKMDEETGFESEGQLCRFLVVLYEGGGDRKSVGVIIANSNCRNIVLSKTWLCVDDVVLYAAACRALVRPSFLLSSLENRVRFVAVCTAADFSFPF